MNLLRLILGLLLVFPTLGKSDGLPEIIDGDLLIDLGAESGTPHKGFGWSRDERVEGRTSCWMKRIEADLWFELETPARKQFELKASPLFIPGKTQKVALLVNDRFVEEWSFPQSDAYEILHADIPARYLKKGRNRITLRAAYRRSPPLDERDLAVNVDWVLLREASQ